MTGYTTEEVARLLGLSPAQIRSYTRAGFLSPARDARGNLRFTFQDLVLLKAAKGLLAARIPAAKIRGSLRRLKQQLPRGRALSELRITAEGHRVVARDEAIAWNPESGQLVLDFDVATLAQRAARTVARSSSIPTTPTRTSTWVDSSSRRTGRRRPRRTFAPRWRTTPGMRPRGSTWGSRWRIGGAPTRPSRPTRRRSRRTGVSRTRTSIWRGCTSRRGNARPPCATYRNTDC